MMEPKVIRTEEAYERMLARIEEIMDAKAGTPEMDELELLSVLVARYEDERYPVDMPDPIAAIRFRMEQQGLTRKDMEAYLGSQARVSEVLSGKRALSKEMIRRLHGGLGIPAEVLLQERGRENGRG
ncbi:MAG: helix-turn-helix domain-containing protein [Anaerolineae bacterium]